MLGSFVSVAFFIASSPAALKQRSPFEKIW